MTTGIESPQSVTVQYYYKGFSILLTKRDPDIEVKTLLKSAMDSIDWALGQGLMPSWNKQTNDEVATQVYQAHRTTQTPNKQEASQPIEEFEKTCQKCQGEKVLNPKTGKWFCKAKCWLK